MQTKNKKPTNLIFFYCFACVLIGCVETAMNQKMFELNHPPVTPIRTVAIKPAAHETVQPTIETFEWEGCPNSENTFAAVETCKTFIADTQRLVSAIQTEGDAEETKFKGKLEMWRSEARIWKIKNNARLKSCEYLVGATGYAVHPELPLALENLKRSGSWLEASVHAAEIGEFNLASGYLDSARRATRQADKLVAGKVKARSRTALVSLPKRLQKHQAIVVKDGV